MLPSICFQAQKLTTVLFSKEINPHTYAQSMLIGSAEKIIALDAPFVDEIKVSFFPLSFPMVSSCVFILRNLKGDHNKPVSHQN